jgi:mRNA-degrading endonuclease RelE of RelBE toxin-antitoxin system
MVRQWRTMPRAVLRFIETPVFTRQVVETLSDSEYTRLQMALVLRPELGDVIPGTGGLRKVRWGEGSRGRGKRGGIRVIYYWYRSESLIYLLLAYSKTERDDLTAEQKRVLRKLVTELE